MKFTDLFLMFVIFSSCSSAQNNSLTLNTMDIERIELINLETSEKKEIINKSEIKSLINAINYNKREVVKFKPKVKIEIFTDKDNILLLYADGYLKYNGKSYKVMSQMVLFNL